MSGDRAKNDATPPDGSMDVGETKRRAPLWVTIPGWILAIWVGWQILETWWS